MWSIGDTKPSTSVATEIVQHSNKARGSVSLNLLGGQRKIKVEDNIQMSFSISAKVSIKLVIIHLLMIMINQNVTVPVKDTTYWCTVVQLPTEERYIYKVAKS